MILTRTHALPVNKSKRQITPLSHSSLILPGMKINNIKKCLPIEKRHIFLLIKMCKTISWSVFVTQNKTVTLVYICFLYFTTWMSVCIMIFFFMQSLQCGETQLALIVSNFITVRSLQKTVIFIQFSVPEENITKYIADQAF